MCAPFREFLPLRVPDGDADLAKHLLIDLADSGAQGRNSGRGVEIKDGHEIFMLKIPFRLQSTPRHQGIGDADGSGGTKLHRDVVLIVLLQKGIVNDAEYILAMFRPIFTCQLFRNSSQLLGKIRIRNTVLLFQHGRHRCKVRLLHFPQPGAAGMFPLSGIRNIKHIAQSGPVPGIIHQRNAL